MEIWYITYLPKYAFLTICPHHSTLLRWILMAIIFIIFAKNLHFWPYVDTIPLNFGTYLYDLDHIGKFWHFWPPVDTIPPRFGGHLCQHYLHYGPRPRDRAPGALPDLVAAAPGCGRPSRDHWRQEPVKMQWMETTPCTVDLPTFPVDYVEMLTKANSRKVLYALHLTWFIRDNSGSPGRSGNTPGHCLEVQKMVLGKT